MIPRLDIAAMRALFGKKTDRLRLNGELETIEEELRENLSAIRPIRDITGQIVIANKVKKELDRLIREGREVHAKYQAAKEEIRKLEDDGSLSDPPIEHANSRIYHNQKLQLLKKQYESYVEFATEQRLRLTALEREIEENKSSLERMKDERKVLLQKKNKIINKLENL